MLKIKMQLNYRRGGTSRNCGQCDHFVKNHPCIGLGDIDLGLQPRCKVIGLEPGRMYRISKNSICDKYVNKRRLRELLGDRAYKQFIERGGSHETA